MVLIQYFWKIPNTKICFQLKRLHIYLTLFFPNSTTGVFFLVLAQALFSVVETIKSLLSCKFLLVPVSLTDDFTL